MHEVAGLTSVTLVLIGVGRYIFAIVSGKAHPSKSTWWIFTLLSDKPNPSIWQLWAFAITPLIIAILSVFKGQKGFGVYDKICMSIAGISILVWLALWNDPSATRIVLLLAILARFMGVIPTIIKAYQDPKSEDKIAWIILTSATIINLFAVKDWSLMRWTIAAFPIYAVIEAFPVLLLILFPKARLDKK
jgi:hypothetical protein